MEKDQASAAKKEMLARRAAEMQAMRKDVEYMSLKADYFETFCRMVNAEIEYNEMMSRLRPQPGEETTETIEKDDSQGQGDSPESPGE